MRRQGFTLVEVTVALLVASLLVFLAHRIFVAGTSAGKTLTEARRSLDRASNVHRFLTAVFLSLEVGPSERQPFEGRSDRVRFWTWLETPDGWFEPAPVEIALEGMQLTAHRASQPPLVLADSVTAVGFDYLLKPGADVRWVAEWISPLRAPVAVRLRVYRLVSDGRTVSDTTLYLVKARG
jgi:prepilin-type N-terminal cleavage/methylation domain-containing protein